MYQAVRLAYTLNLNIINFIVKCVYITRPCNLSVESHKILNDDTILLTGVHQWFQSFWSLIWRRKMCPLSLRTMSFPQQRGFYNYSHTILHCKYNCQCCNYKQIELHNQYSVIIFKIIVYVHSLW